MDWFLLNILNLKLNALPGFKLFSYIMYARWTNELAFLTVLKKIELNSNITYAYSHNLSTKMSPDIATLKFNAFYPAMSA